MIAITTNNSTRVKPLRLGVESLVDRNILCTWKIVDDLSVKSEPLGLLTETNEAFLNTRNEFSRNSLMNRRLSLTDTTNRPIRDSWLGTHWKLLPPNALAAEACNSWTCLAENGSQRVALAKKPLKVAWNLVYRY